VADRPRCDLGHPEQGTIRYRATIYDPAKMARDPNREPEQLVCCRDCGQAIYERDPDRLPKNTTQPDRVAELQAQMKDPEVEMPKPERIRESPDIGRGMGLNPPGYDPPGR
jgi:hypothetical protein